MGTVGDFKLNILKMSVSFQKSLNFRFECWKTKLKYKFLTILQNYDINTGNFGNLAQEASSQKKLIENKTKRREIKEANTWVAKIFTSEKRGAGTNANVFIQAYDIEGKRSEEIPLDNKSDNFESGQERFYAKL